MADPGRRQLAEEIISAFCSEVKPVEARLEHSVLHGDFNEQNILCRETAAGSGEYEVQYDILDILSHFSKHFPSFLSCVKLFYLAQVHSVIDFGDSNRNPLVYEVAITIMYMMTRCRDMI